MVNPTLPQLRPLSVCSSLMPGFSRNEREREKIPLTSPHAAMGEAEQKRKKEAPGGYPNTEKKRRNANWRFGVRCRRRRSQEGPRLNWRPFNWGKTRSLLGLSVCPPFAEIGGWGDLFCVKAVGRPTDGFPNFFSQHHFYFAVSAIRHGKCVRCVATKKHPLEEGQEMRCQNPATPSLDAVYRKEWV